MAKMQHNQTLLLKVVKVDQNKKTIPTRAGTKTKHEIHMLDPKSNETYVGEYLTSGPYDHMFEEGVLQYIKCTRDNEFGFEVTLGVPPNENELEYIPNPHMGKQPQGQIQPPRLFNISGSPVAFGYAYAKDIVAEQIKGMADADKISLGAATLSTMIADLGDALTDRMIKKALDVSK